MGDKVPAFNKACQALDCRYRGGHFYILADLFGVTLAARSGDWLSGFSPMLF